MSCEVSWSGYLKGTRWVFLWGIGRESWKEHSTDGKSENVKEHPQVLAKGNLRVRVSGGKKDGLRENMLVNPLAPCLACWKETVTEMKRVEGKVNLWESQLEHLKVTLSDGKSASWMDLSRVKKTENVKEHCLGHATESWQGHESENM